MAYSYQKWFAPVVIPNSATLIATVPANPTTTILLNGRVRVTNNTTGPIAATLWAVPAAGGTGAGNILINAVSIAQNDWLDTDLPEMAAGDMLYAEAGTASDLTIHFMNGVFHS